MTGIPGQRLGVLTDFYVLLHQGFRLWMLCGVSQSSSQLAAGFAALGDEGGQEAKERKQWNMQIVRRAERP